MAWNSEPELYSNTSAMSPVDSLVLTRLSPSLPPGRLSTLTVMFGFLALKSLTTFSAALRLFSSLLVRNVSVTLPPLPLSLEPRLPALHAPSTRQLTAAAARTPALRNFMKEPPGISVSGTGVEGGEGSAEGVRARSEAAAGDG